MFHVGLISTNLPPLCNHFCPRSSLMPCQMSPHPASPVFKVFQGMDSFKEIYGSQTRANAHRGPFFRDGGRRWMWSLMQACLCFFLLIPSPSSGSVFQHSGMLPLEKFCTTALFMNAVTFKKKKKSASPSPQTRLMSSTLSYA